MTTPAHAFLVELVDVAEELGYGIQEISSRRVKLYHPDSPEVTIEGYLLSPELLRAVLKPVARKGSSS